MEASSPAPLLDNNAWPRAAYVHVPFCAHRCGYCDFTLIAGRDDLIGDYLRCLAREIENSNIPPKHPIDTLFLGGGTPTHPSIVELSSLLEILERHFQLAPGAEFSIEANPLDLTDEKIDLLVSARVNRISLGVQSFSPTTLRLLERDHRPADVTSLMARLRRRIENVSLDLIFGVPGQTLDEWRDTLGQAIDLEPTHLSTYGLTFEPGTAFTTRRARGEIHSVDEELERDQYALAMDLLSNAGFEQYEISNFARPGFQCRHNHVYWNGDEYLAYGPGAARYVHGRRATNIRSVLGWLKRIELNESPIADEETLDASHRAAELIYLGLRRTAGLSRVTFQQKTGFDLDEFRGDVIHEQIRQGLLADDGQNIRLTRAGCFIADRIMMEFL